MAPIVTLAAYDPNDIKPGWIAFWLVLALGVATYLLWRSMNSQLRKIKAPYRDEVEGDAAPSRGDHSHEENNGSSSTSRPQAGDS
jgi:hypothetical protein